MSVYREHSVEVQIYCIEWYRSAERSGKTRHVSSRNWVGQKRWRPIILYDKSSVIGRSTWSITRRSDYECLPPSPPPHHYLRSLTIHIEHANASSNNLTGSYHNRIAFYIDIL